MVDPLYQVEKICPVCEQKFKLTRMRGQVFATGTDSDFCTHYRDLNPYYYAVWACSQCGFAAHEDRFFTFTEFARAKIKEFLSGRNVKLDLSGPRTWEQAVTAHKLAIFYARLAALPASHIASMELRLAWLYREKKMSAEELEMLQHAVDGYQAAYMREQMPIGNMTEITLSYLIGELLRRTGRFEEALPYLSKVVGNPLAKSEKHILELAREAWHATREAKKNAEGAAEEPDAAQ